MDPIYRSDTNEIYVNGEIIYSETVQVDVTEDAITYDLHAKARAAIQANIDFLNNASPTNAEVLAQVRRLTRENTALIRLLIGADLLRDNAGTE